MCQEAPPSAGEASPRPNRAAHPSLGSEQPSFPSPPIGSSEKLWFPRVINLSSPTPPGTAALSSSERLNVYNDSRRLEWPGQVSPSDPLEIQA